MSTPFEQGLLGTGATLVARLLGDDWEGAWLSNLRFENGDVRWFELRETSNIWRSRVIEGLPPGPFPYGLEVEPP